jgi:hypothetical protein
MPRAAGWTALVVAMTFAVFSIGTAAAADGDPISAPTSATIGTGLLMDEYPGPPDTGFTDLTLPFFGVISNDNPACRVKRPYDLGWLDENGELEALSGGTASADGHWEAALSGEPPHPMKMAIYVPAKQVQVEGSTVRCEEVTSASIPFDHRNFTPCALARAEKRGYPLAIRRERQGLQKVLKRRDYEAAEQIRETLREYRSLRAGIFNAPRKRC